MVEFYDDRSPLNQTESSQMKDLLYVLAPAEINNLTFDTFVLWNGIFCFSVKNIHSALTGLFSIDSSVSNDQLNGISQI